MVSMLRTLTATALALVASIATTSEALDVGEYYRPSGTDVSGVPGNTAPYRRSPCPALNTLANHGYLPRDGQGLTHDIVSDAIMEHYNIGAGVAAILVATLPSTFSLDYLSTHNIIEHDASLVHTDSYFGEDPVNVNTTLAADLIARGSEKGYLGVDEVAAARKARKQLCETSNPECDFGVKQSTLAFLEAAVLLNALGGANNEKISTEYATSFLINEQFPSDYTKPSSTVSLLSVGLTTTKLLVAAA